MGIYIALGGNLASQYKGQTLTPKQTFAAVLAVLEEQRVRVLKASSIWQSPAWPDPGAQPAYQNAVIEVQTHLKPLELLAVLQDVEKVFGRTDGVRNAARPIDLDILEYNGQVGDWPGLVLPHPRMLGRAFVLFPLAEITPNWCDPIKKRAILAWIARLKLDDVAPLKRVTSLI